MKKQWLMILLLLIHGTALADGHRIGVGLGSASGEHKRYGESVDLKGELLELPLYTYAADSGLLVGFRLMEFSVSGEIENGLRHTDIAYKQTLLAASIGLEFSLTDKIVIAPQIVKSYFGNSRFHYATYDTDTFYSGYDYEYVTETGTIKGTAELSGWELPVYYAGEFFYFGLKYSTFSNSSEIEWPNGDTSDASIGGALSIVLDARF